MSSNPGDTLVGADCYSKKCNAFEEGNTRQCWGRVPRFSPAHMNRDLRGFRMHTFRGRSTAGLFVRS